MKKRLKHIVITAVVAIIVVLALPLLIYVPPIQRWLVNEATIIASEQTGMDISIEGVSLSFPLDLALDGVLVKQEGDTLADIQRTVVDVQLLPLLEGRVAVDVLEIQDARINTLSMIPDVQVKGRLGSLLLNPSLIKINSGDVNLSEATMADANVTVLLNDTAEVDTTDTGPILWRIGYNEISLLKSQISIDLQADVYQNKIEQQAYTDSGGQAVLYGIPCGSYAITVRNTAGNSSEEITVTLLVGPDSGPPESIRFVLKSAPE